MLNDEASTAELNRTSVLLPPKVKCPAKVSEFRPISLCNVIYRIFAKGVANRYKIVLDAVTSKNQSTFIPNRLIINNVMAGYDRLHKLRSYRLRKSGLVALKLDLSKAYNPLKWSFFRIVYRRLDLLKIGLG